MQKLGGRKINRLKITTVLHPGRRNFTQQLVVNLYFYYLFGISSGLDKQQFQAFANTRSLPAIILEASNYLGYIFRRLLLVRKHSNDFYKPFFIMLVQFTYCYSIGLSRSRMNKSQSIFISCYNSHMSNNSDCVDRTSK